MTELRAHELRFTPAEAAAFLNEVMGLNLPAEHIAALEHRTEGWIAGLQLAGLALQGTIATQGLQEISRFVGSFTGSHHFVLDYRASQQRTTICFKRDVWPRKPAYPQATRIAVDPDLIVRRLVCILGSR